MKYENISESLYIKGRIGWKGLKKGEYLKTGEYRIINGSNISNGVIDWSNCGYITKQRYFESPEIMLKKGDILITKDGTIGKVAIVNKLEYPSTIASGLFILRNSAPEKWNTLFLYYYLQTNRFKEFVHSRTEGSVIPHLYQKDFENLEIPYISLTEQYKISSKLDLIQRKISLNNQINDNLMELKTTIFNKMFSINLTNCLNGKIKDIAEVRTGKRPKIKYSKRGSTPIYPIIGASKIMGYTDEYLYNKSIITTGRVGTLGIVKRYREPVWVSDNSFIFITKYEDYLYELLTHFINYSALNIGSTQPLITQTEFKNVDIYIPKREELIEFKEKVVTLTEQQFELRQQNRLLNDLKSYLLSKLF